MQTNGNKDNESRICTSRIADVSTLLRWVLLSWHEKNKIILGFFKKHFTEVVMWMSGIIKLLQSFLSPSQCCFCKIHHPWESEVLPSVVKFQVTIWGTASVAVCIRRKAPADGDPITSKTKPNCVRSSWGPKRTYDDVRLARVSAGVHTEVALDLVSSLIEQIQVVFHWVSVMKALAQTDNTWCRERAWLDLSSMRIHWMLPLWRPVIFWAVSTLRFSCLRTQTLTSDQRCA